MSKQIDKFNSRAAKRNLDEEAIILAERERAKSRAEQYAQIDPDNLMKVGNIKEAALVASLEGMQMLGQVLVNSMVNEIKPVLRDIVGGMFLEYIEGNRLAMLQYAETVSKQQVREQLAMNLNMDALGGMMTTGNPIMDEVASMVRATSVEPNNPDKIRARKNKSQDKASKRPKPHRGEWTPEEDMVIQDIILNAISTGGKQVEAFIIASEHAELKKHGRTPSAIGFRWNSIIRKTCGDKIEEAKRQRSGQTDKEKNQGVLI